MACPVWGDGTIWGDGTFWCRLFGSQQYTVSVERLMTYVAVQVAHSGSNIAIDRLSLTTNMQAPLSPRYRASFDTDTGEYIAIEVAFSGANIRIDSLRLVGQVKHKHLGNT